METEIVGELRLSIIIPVYNRPNEIRELLQSLLANSFLSKVEVIIVEDGSINPCKSIVDEYKDNISIKYIFIDNSGPSKARNIGEKSAVADYLIFLDSDVVLPPNYISNVLEAIDITKADAFGGPDAATDNFTDIQKSINYAMTSILTTGGIRGSSSNLMEKFKPRSFNLGCKKSVFESIGGFAEDMRFGEDIDFSLRLIEAGYKSVLIKSAFVYHKRRIDYWKFFKQVYNSGIARIILESRHKGSTRWVHRLPMIFTLSVCFSGTTILLPFYIIIFLHCLIFTHNSFRVSLLSPIASFIQLFGYGFGYIVGWINKELLVKDGFITFEKTFHD